MKKYCEYIIASLLLFSEGANACTTFFINQNGKMVFGRNYDWVSGSGMVNTNLRGLAKTSFPMQEGKTISWVSKYGSITFNQYGKEFPTGGMNEKGLVVELMWLDETQYPSPDHRPAISVLQWIQYQLDNCATIEEVLATDKIVRIATVGTTPLHYLVADGKGNAATIEFLQGKMVVHKGGDLKPPVLTNSIYKESVLHIKSASQSASHNGSSLGRFAKACSMVQQYDPKIAPSVIDYSFAILNEVSQGNFTKWSIVYDITELKIYFRTNSHRDIKSVNFNAFDFGCTEPAMSSDINISAAGDIVKKFLPFSSALNLKTVQKSFVESMDRISVPAPYTEKIADYQQKIHCH
ncbi:MAG TPA: linear amide C-N hydrolase [Flavitalea sp.]|nr:linear amide C-N hydrolase [Flavitalea sp.]